MQTLMALSLLFAVGCGKDYEKAPVVDPVINSSEYDSHSIFFHGTI